MIPGHLLIQGDARSIPLADQSVHCVVTSPPYWGLRDYGVSGQIGLEDSIEAYVATMVRVFRKVWRVLRDDGTVWLNLGDSYSSGGRETYCAPSNHDVRHTGFTDRIPPRPDAGIKPKNLCGMPWRVALALQADGWILRSDIVWAKLNPMPESVTDRPTKSHEYLFLFAKSNTTQFWTHRDLPGTRTQPPSDYRWVHEDTNEERANEPLGWREKGSPWDRVNLWTGRDYYWDAKAVQEPDSGRSSGNVARSFDYIDGRYGVGHSVPWQSNGSGRNLRSVWTIATESFPGAHFATYPRKLVEPCIKAGTSGKGCCPQCGAGWVRMSKTLVWFPSCSCHLGYAPGDCNPVPCTVFDPFIGSGTTIVMANALGRHGIGLDLSREYLTNQAKRRIERPHSKPLRPARVEPALPLFGDSND